MTVVLAALLHLGSMVAVLQEQPEPSPVPVFTPTEPTDVQPEKQCRAARITGYNRYTGNNFTYDGTPIMNGEPVVAASWDVPIDSIVEVEGVGTFRTADRGMLGNGNPLTHIDVAVDSDVEAFALTSTRIVCITPP